MSTEHYSRVHSPLKSLRSPLDKNHFSVLFRFVFSDQPDVAFWGVVKLISTQDGISQLPPEDDEKVADLANVMFYFFIICIILLGIYLICSILVIIGAAKVSIVVFRF